MAKAGRRRGGAVPAVPTTPAVPAAQAGPAGRADGAADDGAVVQVLVDVATRLWRSRRHAERLPTPARPLTRELDAALDSLHRAGVVVQDHDGTEFDPGLALIAVAYEPTAGLARERVLETLRPSVYVQGRHVQRGEVVVAVPIPVLDPAAPPIDPVGTATSPEAHDEH